MPDKKNNAPLIMGIVAAVALILIIGAVVLAGGDDGDSSTIAGDDTTTTTDSGPDGKQGDELPDETTSTTRSAPPVDDFPEFVDPADAEPIEVLDQGYRIIADERDPDDLSITYGVTFENPNGGGLAASGVEFTIAFYDESGTVVETQSDFVSVLLPGQVSGIGNIVFGAPAGVVRMDVRTEVSNFVVIDDVPGDLAIEDITNTPEEFGGFTVDFVLSSTFPERMESLQVGAVFRNDAGEIVGGYFTFVEFVDADGRTSGEVNMFLDLPEATSVELFPTVGVDFLFPD